MFYRISVLSLLFVLCVVSLASAGRLLNWDDPKAKIPESAKPMQCVGSAARRVCVNDSHLEPERTFGSPIMQWRNKAKDVVTEIFEFNGGRVACWFELRDVVYSIRCVGLERP